MSKPHKHAKEIKAWADGAEIECYCRFTGKWFYQPSPMWTTSFEYRVKHKKPTRFLVIKELSNSSIFVNQSLPHEDVEKYFKLHELVQEFETDWHEQDCHLYEIPNGKYVFMYHGKYVSLGALNMSKQCAEKLCEMLNNRDIEL